MSPSSRDSLLSTFTRVSACISGGLVLLIGLLIALWAWPALYDVGLFRFLTDGSWHPREGAYDLRPMLLGSLTVSFGSILVAMPLGILTVVFADYYAPRPFAWLLGRVIEVLGAVPSVVFGLWGLVSVVPWIAEISPPGQSLGAAVLVLSVMTLPTIALTAKAAIDSVPRESVRGAAALGLGRAAVIRRVVLPAARTGLFAGVVLAFGRALGETMAVLMVSGNVIRAPASLFDPIRTITANIALEMGYATSEHRSALFVSALALIVVVAGLVAATSAGKRGPRAS